MVTNPVIQIISPQMMFMYYNNAQRMKNKMEQYQAFTATCNGIANKLLCDVMLSNENYSMKVSGQWDTGATNSCISHDVVSTLNLNPVGFANVKTPSGRAVQSTYKITVSLPNHLDVTDVQVNESEIGEQGIGILIGMDIIRHGDFTVSNHDGKTVFSFRYPSVAVTDYVQLIESKKPKTNVRISPNALCPCGSGQKYKRCCGNKK